MEQGRVDPALRDPELVAQAVWASLHGVAALHLARFGDPWVQWRTMKDTAMLLTDALLKVLAR